MTGFLVGLMKAQTICYLYDTEHDSQVDGAHRYCNGHTLNGCKVFDFHWKVDISVMYQIVSMACSVP